MQKRGVKPHLLTRVFNMQKRGIKPHLQIIYTQAVGANLFRACVLSLKFLNSEV